MGVFSDQITMRDQLDQEMLSVSLAELADVVTGDPNGQQSALDDAEAARGAIEAIFAYLHIPVTEPPSDVTGMAERLDFMIRPSGVMKRRVRLPEGWWKDSVGPLLAATTDGGAVALLPHGRHYRYRDAATGRTVRMSRKTAGILTGDAYCFYKPFPQKPLTIFHLIRFIVTSLDWTDYALVALASMAIIAAGMVTPYVTDQIFNSVIPLGRQGLIAPIACMLFASAIASALFQLNDTILGASIESKMSIRVHSAAMARLLSLPADFFKRFSSGETASRLENVSELCETLREAVINNGILAVFSFAYVFQMAAYAPPLALPAVLLMLANAAFSFLSAWMRIGYERKSLQADAKLKGLSFALYTGIQKIKLSGAEKRMFARWGHVYRERATLTYRPPAIIRLAPVINKLFDFGGLIVLYACATAAQVPVADYLAFFAAYGMGSVAIMKLAGIVQTIANIKPMLEMVEPILREAPETSDGKRPFTHLKGAIELDHVTFRYEADKPPVLDDLCLSIKPNEYVAIVGRTGCGKSTLMRLLLGFETPEAGIVSYDGQDITKLDIRSVRRNIGVVLQEGKLFAGDLYANISVSAPWITMDEAMQAATMAGMKDDIERMPMGLRTMISEGSGGISGGQRQRIMIARAIAGKPKILMFDEATSALDNITQKQVTDALDGLRCTRIVIAHRLSTIRHCDRICVLDGGRIAESGTFDELVARDGIFAELVRRQMM